MGVAIGIQIWYILLMAKLKHTPPPEYTKLRIWKETSQRLAKVAKRWGVPQTVLVDYLSQIADEHYKKKPTGEANDE